MISFWIVSESQFSLRFNHADTAETQLHWGVVLSVTIATILYCVVGGLIFQAIELPNEKAKFQEAKVYLNETLNSLNSTSRKIILDLAHKLLHEFLPYVVFENNEMKQKDDWNLFGSMLYASTIITTIGYGNIVPRTNVGRGITILYACVGIPLFVFTMACLASKMYGSMARLSKVNPKCNKRFREQKAIVLITYTFVGGILFIMVPTIIFKHTEKWSYFESFYFSFVTLSTIGFGDYVPHQTPGTSAAYLISVTLYIACGLAWLSGLVAAASDWWSARYRRAYERVIARVSRIHARRRSAGNNKKSTNDGEVNGDNSQSTDQQQQKEGQQQEQELRQQQQGEQQQFRGLRSCLV